MTNTVTFHRIYPDARDPLAGDTAALGLLPTVAFQYCEPVRTASAYGWYIFAPKDFSLLWDGKDVFYADDGQWRTLTSLPFEETFRQHWNTHAPADLQDADPPFLSKLIAPGVVQIWSGYLVETAPGWSANIRPVVNAYRRSAWSAFEGIVDTDTFKPAPLFINIQLHTTDREILFRSDEPLFQIQPIERSSFTKLTAGVTEGLDQDPSFAWSDFKSTIRLAGEEPPVGRYAKDARKRKRR